MKYLFRVAPGKTPFSVGTASKNMGVTNGRLKDVMYVSPCLYSWVNHYFNNEDNRVFVIERPSNLNPLTMCCGINSVYHYAYVHKDKETEQFVRNCVIKKDFKNPRLVELTEELNERVKKKFGKSLKEMKGGIYLGTLMDWDRHPNMNGYPELILSVGLLRKCRWEELEYSHGDIFVGKKTGKVFRIERKLDKPGLRYKP